MTILIKNILIILLVWLDGNTIILIFYKIISTFILVFTIYLYKGEFKMGTNTLLEKTPLELSKYIRILAIFILLYL